MALHKIYKSLGIITIFVSGVIFGIILFFLFRPKSILNEANEFRNTNFNEAPNYVGFLKVDNISPKERPFGVALMKKNLLISYAGSDRIDEYSDNLQLIRTIYPLSKQKASFTGIDVDENHVYIADNFSGNFLIIDYLTGDVIKEFGFLPDQKTKLNCFGVKHYSNNLYLTDNKLNKIFVVSLEAIPEIKDEFELILSFPNDSANELLEFPSFINLTDDGRIIVADVGNKSIKAFTCNGRFAHNFDLNHAPEIKAPMGIGIDNLISEEMIARSDSIFDPSGIYRQGRIHIADPFLKKILVFNQFGKYLFAYGEELKEPNGIAVDTTRRLIFIADSELIGVAIYKY